MKILLLFLIFLNAYSQEKISCFDGDCSFSGNLNVSNETEFLNHSQFEIEYLEEDLDIELPSSEIPRDFVSLIRTKNNEGKDLNISLKSSNAKHDSPRFILFSDIIDILQINTDGYDGIISNDASNICADKIISGGYGNTIKLFYESRRNNDPSLGAGCDSLDLAEIKSDNFSCDIGDSVSTQEIVANRWEEKSKCEGNAYRFLCIDRKLNMNCSWIADGGSLLNQNVCCDSGATQPAGSGWVCNPANCNINDNNSGWTKDNQVKVAESIYNADLLAGKSPLQICNQYFNRLPYSDLFNNNIIHYGLFSGTYKNRPGSLNTPVKYPDDDPSNYTFLPSLTEYSGGAVGHCKYYDNCFASSGLELAKESNNTEGWTGMNTRFNLGSGGYYNNSYDLQCQTTSTNTQCSLWQDDVNTHEGWNKVTSYSYYIKYKFLSSKGFVVEQIDAIGRGHY